MNKYIRFDEVPNPGKKTKIMNVINKSGDYSLGKIHWHCGWRQYVFRPEIETIYSHDCMQSIIEEVKRLNVTQRQSSLSV